MPRPDDNLRIDREDPPETKLMTSEERERRWADIQAGRIPPDIEASPEMQELLRSQEEFRANIKAAVRKITGR